MFLQMYEMKMMSKWGSLANIRREYGHLNLHEHSIDKCPIKQFKKWFEEVLLVEKTDPTAMVLSTVDEKGYPDSRVVLLKGLEDQSFVFYTNYESTKAVQLHANPYASLNFYWAQMARQVRIRGRVKRVPQKQSDAYFSSRPVVSQLSAMISPQSKEITSREELEDSLNKLITQYGQEPIIRPKNWGGYMVIPDEIEFWQGRDNRLHDRLLYYKKRGEWSCHRLAP